MSQTKAQLIDNLVQPITGALGSASAPTFSFTSDPNTGLYSPGADQVAISTAGSGRLFVDASGRVGVNTNSPTTVASRVIHVSGSSGESSALRLTGNAGTGFDFIQALNGDGFIYQRDNNPLIIGTNNLERLRITSAGLVGVGTSTPQKTFHVLNPGSPYNADLRLGGTSAYYFDLTHDAGTTGKTIYNAFASSGASHGHQFQVSGTNALLIDSSGRVGIGTASPGSALHVSGSGTVVQQVQSTGGATELKLIANTQTNASYNNIYSGDGTNWNWRIGGSDGTTNTLTFATGGSERARIDSSGRLLVGTSSGTKVLTVSQIGGDGDGIQLIHPTRTGKWLISHSGTASENLAFIQNNGTTDNTSYVMGRNEHRISTGNVERWVIDSSGSLIGAAGSAIVAPYVYNSTTVSAANVHVQSAGFLLRATSSIKYKTNVETIQDQYADAILGCRPVWYQSTCETDKPEWGHWGFIAEEVAEIDPRLCLFKEEDDGTLEPEGVQYDRFVPHLLNLIKRQGEAIAELQAEVAALKAQ